MCFPHAKTGFGAEDRPGEPRRMSFDGSWAQKLRVPIGKERWSWMESGDPRHVSESFGVGKGRPGRETERGREGGDRVQVV